MTSEMSIQIMIVLVIVNLVIIISQLGDILKELKIANKKEKAANSTDLLKKIKEVVLDNSPDSE